MSAKRENRLLVVSVHIVTYNSEKKIGACLNSVFFQTYPFINVIVVDNGSKDNTKQVLKQYDNIDVITNDENAGFAAAQNQAISRSTGDYILVLNPDVVMENTYIENLIRVFEERPFVGSVSGKLMRRMNHDIVDSTGLIIKKSRRVMDRVRLDVEAETTRQSEVFGVSGAAALYSREMIDDISIDNQFFDESFFAYKEDVDVAWRARICGWVSYYVPVAIAYHERGWKEGERKYQPRSIRTHSYINRYRMLIKNDNFEFLMKHFLYFVFFELLTFGYVLIFEPFVLLGWIKLIKDFPRLVQERRKIRELQKAAPGDVYCFFQ